MMKTRKDEERAKFLAFSQHVQYWKTKKQVFVSDYQGKQSFNKKLIDTYIPSPGSNMLLSDPQISSAG